MRLIELSSGFSCEECRSTASHAFGYSPLTCYFLNYNMFVHPLHELFLHAQWPINIQREGEYAIACIYQQGTNPNNTVDAQLSSGASHVFVSCLYLFHLFDSGRFVALPCAMEEKLFRTIQVQNFGPFLRDVHIPRNLFAGSLVDACSFLVYRCLPPSLSASLASLINTGERPQWMETQQTIANNYTTARSQQTTPCTPTPPPVSVPVRSIPAAASPAARPSIEYEQSKMDKNKTKKQPSTISLPSAASSVSTVFTPSRSSSSRQRSRPAAAPLNRRYQLTLKTPAHSAAADAGDVSIPISLLSDADDASGDSSDGAVDDGALLASAGAAADKRRETEDKQEQHRLRPEQAQLLDLEAHESFSPLSGSSPLSVRDFHRSSTVKAHWRIHEDEEPLTRTAPNEPWRGRGLALSLHVRAFEPQSVLSKSPLQRYHFHCPFSLADCAPCWYCGPALGELTKGGRKPDIVFALADSLAAGVRPVVADNFLKAFAAKMRVAARSGWIIESRDLLASKGINYVKHNTNNVHIFKENEHFSIASAYFRPVLSAATGPDDSAVLFEVYITPRDFLLKTAIRSYIEVAARKRLHLFLDLHQHETSLVYCSPGQDAGGATVREFVCADRVYDFVIRPGAREFLQFANERFEVHIYSGFPIEQTKELINVANHVGWLANGADIADAQGAGPLIKAENVHSCHGYSGIRKLPLDSSEDYYCDVRQSLQFARMEALKNVVFIFSDHPNGWKAHDHARIFPLREATARKETQQRPHESDKANRSLLKSLKLRLSRIHSSFFSQFSLSGLEPLSEATQPGEVLEILKRIKVSVEANKNKQQTTDNKKQQT